MKSVWIERRYDSHIGRVSCPVLLARAYHERCPMLPRRCDIRMIINISPTTFVISTRCSKHPHPWMNALLKIQTISKGTLNGPTMSQQCCFVLRATADNYTLDNHYFCNPDRGLVRAFYKVLFYLVVETRMSRYPWVENLVLGSLGIKALDSIVVSLLSCYWTWIWRCFMQEFKLWDGELKLVDSFLQSDVRNNSAWNHRFYVITHTSGFTDEVINREIEYDIMGFHLYMV